MLGIVTFNKAVLRMAAFALTAFGICQLSANAQSPAQPNQTIVTGETVMVGLASGDVLRFNAFNPLTTDWGRPNEPIAFRLKFFDKQGREILETAEVEIAPGEFRSIELNRYELPVTGEPGTTRAQVRTVPL